MFACEHPPISDYVESLDSVGPNLLPLGERGKRPSVAEKLPLPRRERVGVRAHTPTNTVFVDSLVYRYQGERSLGRRRLAGRFR